MHKKLFTPGPLTTTIDVKKSMLYDLGSRDEKFIEIVKFIRNELLKISLKNTSDTSKFETIIVQGSGTYGNEAVLNSLIPKNDKNNKLLIISNGKYGERLFEISTKTNIITEKINFDYNKNFDMKLIENKLLDDNIKFVAMVHHETSTGQINDIKSIGKLCKSYDKTFIIDAMSSFGGYHIDLVDDNIDFLVSSPNKCLEGVPGFSFILCNKEKLKLCKYSTSLTLDILKQYEYMEKTGQFRFTPPTHTLLAFKKAIEDFWEEGGLESRINKYKKLNQQLLLGLTNLGFKCLLDEEFRGYFITSFLYFNNNFEFNKFYDFLSNKGLIIYPGDEKNKTFRIGNIGNLTSNDITNLIEYTKTFIINL